MPIQKLFFYPPLAFGRLGGSPEPMPCYTWGPNDSSVRGTGMTTVIPAETLVVADDGTVSAVMPVDVRFKDAEGRFHPVCPFFELHATWDEGDGPQSGPVTPALLARFGLALADLRWHVHVANHKPYNMTEDPDTRIDAEIDIAGDDVGVKTLAGHGPPGAKQPLVPPDTSVPLGRVRLTRPDDAFPEVRLRFIAAEGLFFGPTNLLDRWQIDIPKHQLNLNPESSWASWKPALDDARGTPGGQYAQDDDGVSYGMVDDVCDGLIRCRIQGLDLPAAVARISVGPPDYAPDRRHFTSLADGLKDRVDRADVWSAAYYADMDEVTAEILDLFERIGETASLNNVDVFNNRVDIQENKATAFALGEPYGPDTHKAFVPPLPLDDRPLPLSDRAREYHRRLATLEVLEDMLRKQPQIVQQWVRAPAGASLYFDKQMPLVMRGPSGDPLHLTRRQYDLLRAWVQRLRPTTDTTP